MPETEKGIGERHTFDEAISALDEALLATGKLTVIHRVRRATVALMRVLELIRDDLYPDDRS